MNRRWYQARLRWAVMADDEGLRHWKESIVMFRAGDDSRAFETALEIGRRQQHWIEEGDCGVATLLAEVVTLDCLGEHLPAVVEITIGDLAATERLPATHRFWPEAAFPPPSF